MIWMLVVGRRGRERSCHRVRHRPVGSEIPRAVETLDAFGREMRPALIRVSAATEDVRARTTRR